MTSVIFVEYTDIKRKISKLFTYFFYYGIVSAKENYFMTSFALKLIALISMLFDHCGYIFFNRVTFFNVIGKVSFPIFAFQISEGYKHTKKLKLYFFRLFVFAIASQIPFMLFLFCLKSSPFYLNIFFTLFLGLLAITIYDKSKSKPVGLLLVCFIVLIAELIHCDYGWFGVSIIFLFYLFKDKKVFMNLSFILVVIIRYSILYLESFSIFQIYFMVASCLALIFINLYNGEKGKNIKYLFYLFYPVHLLILVLIKLLA